MIRADIGERVGKGSPGSWLSSWEHMPFPFFTQSLEAFFHLLKPLGQRSFVTLQGKQRLCTVELETVRLP